MDAVLSVVSLRHRTDASVRNGACPTADSRNGRSSVLLEPSPAHSRAAIGVVAPDGTKIRAEVRTFDAASASHRPPRVHHGGLEREQANGAGSVRAQARVVDAASVAQLGGAVAGRGARPRVRPLALAGDLRRAARSYRRASGEVPQVGKMVSRVG